MAQHFLSETVVRPYTPARAVHAFLNSLETNDLDDLTPASVVAVRATRETLAQASLFPIPIEMARDFAVPGAGKPVPVRLYTPHDKQLAMAGALPILVFIHGGGWSIGSISTYDAIARELARKVPALVLSIGYRLAPRNPYPAALEDVDSVMSWLCLHARDFGGDPSRVALAGDSGGGTLATVVARKRAKYSALRIVFQALFYPSTDISRTDFPSYEQYGAGFMLTTNAVKSFRDFYLPDPRIWQTPDVAPLYALDLEKSPPALIVTAGCDPLRDEGQAYAAKLCAHGVAVHERLEPEMIHAFLSFFNLLPGISPYAEGTLAYAAAVIREAFSWPVGAR
jgi:acetyl esterase